LKTLTLSMTILLTAMSLSSCALPSGAPGPAGGAESPTSAASSATVATTAQVLEAVKAAEGLDVLPDSVAATLAKPSHAAPTGKFDCHLKDNPIGKISDLGECTYGDNRGTKTMVIYGDSRAQMWGAALEGVASRSGWKLLVYSLPECPAIDLSLSSLTTGGPNDRCDAFRGWVLGDLPSLHPDLIITTGNVQRLADGTPPTDDQWKNGLMSMWQKLGTTGARLAVLGMSPAWPNDDPRCLAAHVRAVQECSSSPADAIAKWADVEQAAAAAAGVFYVATTPWVCADRCEPVIDGKLVYQSQYHFTQEYSVFLSGAVGESLRPLRN
jgi:hypothetical protein